MFSCKVHLHGHIVRCLTILVIELAPQMSPLPAADSKMHCDAQAMTEACLAAEANHWPTFADLVVQLQQMLEHHRHGITLGKALDADR